MQLSRFADVPTSPRDRVFQYSRVHAVAATVVVVVGSIGLMILGRFSQSGLSYYVAAVFPVALLVLQTFVRARFRPTNWLVRATDGGLFVQFRSYLNYRFPPQHLTVAFVPYGDLRSVRVILEHRRIPDRDLASPRLDAGTEQRRTVVELELKGDVESLTRAVDEEIERCFGHGPRSDIPSTRYRHVPIRMTSPTTMQLEWKVTPSANMLLAVLRDHGVATDVGEEAADFQQLAHLTREDQERRLVELVETGQMIAAIDIARRLYGYDLTRAKTFIDDLRGRRPR